MKISSAKTRTFLLVLAASASAAAVTVPFNSPDEVTRALQQATGPTYSPTISGAPTLDSTSANTATTTNEGTNAGTADGTVAVSTDGTVAGTTGDAIAISISTSSTAAMTGTGATITTEATGSGGTSTSTTGAAATSDSWMVCQQDLATPTSLNMDDTLTFYHYVALAPEGDSRGGILCGRLERADGTDGWIGFGMSPDGEMDDGIGIIGLPDDGTVEKYWLNGEDPMVERMSDDKQTLMFSSITQDQDGTTIMEFAKFLNEADELPILANGDNIFLYALGGSNELGFHSSGMSSFTLDLKTPAAATSSTSTSATTNSAVTTETSSTTFAIEATVTAPSTEEPSDKDATNAESSDKEAITPTTPAPMEFATGGESSAFTINSVMYSMSWALLVLCVLFKL